MSEQKAPKRFEDYTFLELLELGRNTRRSRAGMERVMRGPYRNPILDSSARPNAARGPRPDTFYKQQQRNITTNKALEVPPSAVFTK